MPNTKTRQRKREPIEEDIQDISPVAKHNKTTFNVTADQSNRIILEINNCLGFEGMNLSSGNTGASGSTNVSSAPQTATVEIGQQASELILTENRLTNTGKAIMVSAVYGHEYLARAYINLTSGASDKAISGELLKVEIMKRYQPLWVLSPTSGSTRLRFPPPTNSRLYCCRPYR